MRTLSLSVVAVVGLASAAAAQERFAQRGCKADEARREPSERFVERTPLPRRPVMHTMERAGNPQSVKPRATPSVTTHDAGGYVGGGTPRGNNVLVKGVGAAPGPVQGGTFGTDYVGPRLRSGRVFLAPSYDPSVGPTVARAYRTDGPHVPDVFSLRPLRNAVLEMREVTRGQHGQ